MFASVAKGFKEIRAEERVTVTERCERALSLADNHDTTVYWCNRNDEGDLLQQLDKTAYQIKGSMHIDKKEELLIAFQRGEIKKLITKPKITCFGLNWQHCNHTVYFPTFSYEQYYQAIRRFWRFGQKDNVIVDMIFSNGQTKVINSLFEKSKKADALFSQLNQAINETEVNTDKHFNTSIELPRFL